ncbi:hypothetical protein H6776_00250 [Candidatus Nomurabacteria bacterium]|nr:hypothetical protein [Candidatus Nomurabacteria bacterium]
MNTQKDTVNSSTITQTLQSAPNPTKLVLERLYRRAFELAAQEDPYTDTAYRHLKNLDPVKIGNEYKGDAVEFMTGTVQGTYQTLRDLVARLANSIDATPFAGEHITAFIERVADQATGQMLGKGQ